MISKVLITLATMFCTFMINALAVHFFERGKIVQTFVLFGFAMLFAMVSIGCVAMMVIELCGL